MHIKKPVPTMAQQLLSDRWDHLSDAERIDLLKALLAPVPHLRQQAMQ